MRNVLLVYLVFITLFFVTCKTAMAPIETTGRQIKPNDVMGYHSPVTMRIAWLPYEDLTNLCVYMMLFRTVPCFPWRMPRMAMSMLLGGYVSENSLNHEELMAYLSLGIMRYYMKNSVMHDGISTLSGMPISKARLERLVLQILHKDYDEAFDGVKF